MKVIDHEPHAWFLLQDDQALLLDVSCEHHAVGYSVLIELDREERAGHANGGHTWVDRLAEAIRFSAPGVRGSSSPYTERNIDGLRGRDVLTAVVAWGATTKKGAP